MQQVETVSNSVWRESNLEAKDLTANPNAFLSLRDKNPAVGEAQRLFENLRNLSPEFSSKYQKFKPANSSSMIAADKHFGGQTEAAVIAFSAITGKAASETFMFTGKDLKLLRSLVSDLSALNEVSISKPVWSENNLSMEEILGKEDYTLSFGSVGPATKELQGKLEDLRSENSRFQEIYNIVAGPELASKSIVADGYLGNQTRAAFTAYKILKGDSSNSLAINSSDLRKLFNKENEVVKEKPSSISLSSRTDLNKVKLPPINITLNGKEIDITPPISKNLDNDWTVNYPKDFEIDGFMKNLSFTDEGTMVELRDMKGSLNVIGVGEQGGVINVSENIETGILEVTIKAKEQKYSLNPILLAKA